MCRAVAGNVRSVTTLYDRSHPCRIPGAGREGEGRKGVGKGRGGLRGQLVAGSRALRIAAAEAEAVGRGAAALDGLVFMLRAL